VAEAAPPGTVKAKPKAAEPSASLTDGPEPVDSPEPVADPDSPFDTPPPLGIPEPFAPPPPMSVSEVPISSSAPSPPITPSALGDPYPLPEHPPDSVAPASSHASPHEERPPSLMGRLKGLFKKG
jgi:hypothetical protein